MKTKKFVVVKAEKSPPSHLGEVFFSLPFSFSDKHRQWFVKHGVTKDVVDKIETTVAELSSYYDVQATPLVDHRNALLALHKAFTACATQLEQTDKSALAILNGEGLPKTGVAVLKLWELIIKYGEGARKTANRIAVKRGQDARRNTDLTVAVGQALTESGIKLDNTAKGIFTISMGIVFEAREKWREAVREEDLKALRDQIPRSSTSRSFAVLPSLRAPKDPGNEVGRALKIIATG